MLWPIAAKRQYLPLCLRRCFRLAGRSLCYPVARRSAGLPQLVAIRRQPEAALDRVFHGRSERRGPRSGCATISGTPAAGSKGSYPLTVYYDIYAHAVLFGTPIGQSMKDSTTRYTLYVDGATGLSSISPNAFRVYPNPAKGGFTISNLTSEQIQLFNALGQEFTLSAESTTASGSYFNTGNLPKGFYFIRANNKLGEKILIE